ncbi:alkaline phosphatase D family protein [Corynebacterium sp.]|uniref:alkaline phosphatase D family protein n=1 Tax=Corynebacterium sp. TaxID=1720 RepID=UPI002A911EA8|nr:alkaline phosphatase D family protein [Corynebacterium sp.]MDY5784875.1 alkaline phosphatase D family protein [Corynebacterium sp.]
MASFELSRSPLPRRSFLIGSGIAAASVAAAPGAHAQSSGSSLPGAVAFPGAPESEYSHFMHGVASGDPTPESVILWTRVTVSPDAVPGSGIGADATVGWEVAVDPDFAQVVRTGTAQASAASDHTVHVDPHGLNPATVYFYRFTYNGVTSPVGRTKTAPAYDAAVDEITFAVASCANWEAGYFAAYRDMAERGERGEFDAVVFLGDYIYEYPTGGYAGKSGVSRPHSPLHETITLADYRMRHGRYKQDLNLQRAHASAPWIVVWDDHETANNAWRAGAENHIEGAEGAFADRRAAGQRAYFEWLPVRATRPSDGGHIYRSLQFGNLLNLTMLDLRSYRDEQVARHLSYEEGRTMLGNEQMQWLASTVRTNTATWNVMGNSVMVAPMVLGRLPETSSDAVLANRALGRFAGLVSGFPLNPDQWDGYASARKELFDVLAADDANVLFLTGDIHTEWANSVIHDGREIGCELVTASISAANVDDWIATATQIRVPEDNSVSHLAEGLIRQLNPWVKHLDFDAHGYAVTRIRRSEIGMEFYRVSDVEHPEAAVHLAATKLWRVGEGFIS